MKKLLILGAFGYLGPHVVRELEEHDYELRLTDLEVNESPHESFAVDVSDAETVRRAAEGVDAIVNLSVLRQDRKLAFDVSTRGCFNMMRAAVEHGIKRVVNTGPHFTVAGRSYEYFDGQLSPDIPIHPGTLLYAHTKGLGQEICRVFSVNHDIHVLCLLFYNFANHDEIEEREDRVPFLVTWRDAARAVRLALEVDTGKLPSRCEVFNVLGDMPHERFSNEKTKRLLGFAPQDRLDVTWQK